MGELTVIIPTWNRKDLLRNCLSSLQRQTVPCSVLVVDNGSTDSTQEMVKTDFPSFDSLSLHSNQGFAKAVNLGIQSTGSSFVALLNNDTEADPLWVEAGLHAFLSNREYSFFASRMIRYCQRTHLDCAGDCYNRNGLPYKRGLGEPVSQFSVREPVLGASAGAAFYRRSLFDEVGLFDESFFMYLEDVDLSLRAQLAGHRCLYLPDAIVYHIEAASDPERIATGRSSPVTGRQPTSRSAGQLSYYSAPRVYWITRNRWQLMVTYQPLRHAPWLLYGWTRSALFHLLKAGFLAPFLRGLAAGLLRTPQALRKRMVTRRNRLISVRRLCQLMQQCSPSA